MNWKKAVKECSLGIDIQNIYRMVKIDCPEVTFQEVLEARKIFLTERLKEVRSKKRKNALSLMGEMSNDFNDSYEYSHEL